MDRFRIFERMANNASEGEIGSIFVTPYYGLGEEGYWEAGIPRYMSLRLDYQIDLLRYKEVWEDDEKVKVDELLIFLNDCERYFNKIKDKEIDFEK